MALNPSDSAKTLEHAGSLKELRRQGCLVKTLGQHTVALFYHENQVFAVDNRCPHMGFALSRGSVKDGILTCPWHHARFELCSGGAFDLFADDARVFPTQVQDGEVWVDVSVSRDELGRQRGRLKDGLMHNLSLVLAKACITLLNHGGDPADILRIAGVFGATQRAAGWRDGLTILTALGNILPQLRANDRPLALYHGVAHVADNIAGQRPRYSVDPLPVVKRGAALPAGQLKGWLRDFAEVRDGDGVERVLLSAIAAGYKAKQVADMLAAAVTDHYYLDGGHSIDFVNKAFELLDTISWQHAAEVLPSIIPGIIQGRRMEETSSWRRPVDLTAILEPIFTELLSGGLMDSQLTLSDEAFDSLVTTLLGDDAEAGARALLQALQGGAALTELSQALCYAAALRVARFHTSNEFGDWLNVLHTFTAANATHQLLTRAPSPELARSIWHVAMDLYLQRFLNAPAARLPRDSAVADLSDDASTLLREMLELTNMRQQVEQAAALTYRYLQLGHPDTELIETLAHSLLREDAEFHSYQMLEASLRLYQDLKVSHPKHAPDVLIALARYLAGHAPTDRATTQTYRIAERLQRGEVIAAS